MTQWFTVSLQTISSLLSQHLSFYWEGDSNLHQGGVFGNKTITACISSNSSFWRAELLPQQLVPPLFRFQGADPVSVFIPVFISLILFQMISRMSQGTKPAFFPLATLMKPLCSLSLLTQIWPAEKKHCFVNKLMLQSRFKKNTHTHIIYPSIHPSIHPFILYYVYAILELSCTISDTFILSNKADQSDALTSFDAVWLTASHYCCDFGSLALCWLLSCE